ncbi:MAG: CvpA family protein [bacterium]
MCWIDIVILIIILSLIVQGLISGFIRGIFDLAGILAGIFLAIEYAEKLKMARFFGFLLIFIGTVIVISIVGRIISKIIHLTPLGIMDRLMGGALGFVKGIFFCFVFLLLLFLLNKQSTLEKCEIAPIILKSGVSVSQALPEKWYKWIKKTVGKKEVVEVFDISDR